MSGVQFFQRLFSLLPFLLMVFVILAISSCDQSDDRIFAANQASSHYSFELSDIDLKTARSTFTTEILWRTFIKEAVPVPPAELFSIVYYPSQQKRLAAYLTPDPQDGLRYPAVIWIHGGYGGIGDNFWQPQPANNDQSGRQLREAGIVMMIPSFRGENNNAGEYEMFYGEMEDLEYARNYLAQLPYVDPERIYLMGHSTGGTAVLLGNEYVAGFRAAFSLGGIPDLKLRVTAGRMAVDPPFNIENPLEFQLRSPRTFMRFLHSPTFYFEGGRYYWREFDEMQQIALAEQLPFYAYRIKQGDHFNIIAPITQLVAQKILQDTGITTNIRFDSQDIVWIEKNIVR